MAVWLADQLLLLRLHHHLKVNHALEQQEVFQQVMCVEDQAIVVSRGVCVRKDQVFYILTFSPIYLYSVYEMFSYLTFSIFTPGVLCNLRELRPVHPVLLRRRVEHPVKELITESLPLV